MNLRAITDALTHDDARTRGNVDRARDALFAATGQRAPAPRRLVHPALRAGLAAAAAFALVLGGATVARFAGRESPALGFRIDKSTPPVGSRIDATELTHLAFDDGTGVDLAAGTQARVMQITAHGAELLLERGSAELRVVHRDAQTKWTLHAGPYQVHVVGTTFRATYVGSALRVRMTEGRVQIEGCGKDLSLVSGQSVTLDCATDALARERVDAEPALTVTAPVPSSPATPLGSTSASTTASAALPGTRAAAPAPEPRATANDVPTTSDGDTVIDRAALPKPPAPTWREHYAHGRYAEAYTLIDGSFDETLAASDAGDLLRLGEIARLSRHVARSESAYALVRSRHPGTPAAAEAAFHLARIQADREAFDEAARLFAVYRREAPRGTLVREAMGREAEALSRGGRVADAKALATTYLAQFPDGPHAPIAKRILEAP